MDKYFTIICVIIISMIKSSEIKSVQSTPVSGYNIQEFIQSNSSGEPTSLDVFDSLIDMEIPLLMVTTDNFEEPYYEIIEHPDGCWGTGITNTTKVPSRMKIYKKSKLIYDSGDYAKGESGLTIKVRGNTSALQKKKSYKLKLQKKADLLFRGEDKYNDKEWVLLNSGQHLNAMAGFLISESIDQTWTPSYKIVNLCLNGKYYGLYYLVEAISMNQKCRINVDEDEGYIVEYDPYFWNEDISIPSHIDNYPLEYTFKYPDSDDLTNSLFSVISEDIEEIEHSIINGEYANSIDVESFAKWILAWDILGSWDSAGGNMFLVKYDSQSKIQMGPLWDFDCAFTLQDEWAGIHTKMFYFPSLFGSDDPEFLYKYNNIWHSEGRGIISRIISHIKCFLNSTEGKDYFESCRIEQLIPEINEVGHNYDPVQMIGDIEIFLNNRANWLDLNIPLNLSSLDILEDIEHVNNSYFDLMGRKITPLSRGLYIYKGKKILK